MSEQVSTVNAADIATAREGQTVLAGTVSHPIGEITSGSDTVSVGRLSSQHPMKLPTGDLNSFLARPVEIESGVISNADTPYSAIATYDPWVLFLQTTSIADKTANYTYFRGTLNITFVLSAPGNCYGLYALAAIANSQVPDLASWLAADLHVNNCLQTDQSAAIDVALSTTVELKLPFICPNDYATIASQGVNLWRVHLYCLNPVGTGIESGVTEAYFKIYAHTTDLELVVPHFQAGPKKHLKFLEDTHAKVKSLGISSVARAVTDAASNLSRVPVIGAFATPVAQAAGMVADVASWFGFTRETAEVEPTPIVARALCNIAHYDGNDVSELASLTIANAISVDATLGDGVSEDVAAFSSLFSRPTLVATAAWATTATSGTTLLTVPVTPFLTRSTNDTSIYLTTAGFCGLPFQYWRGDISYKVFIPCSKLHRGAFQVAWVPMDSSETGIDLTNVTMNVVRELECGMELDIKVGFAREKPALRGEISTFAGPINDEEMNGRLVFRVVNPLRSQNDLASVNIVVFQYADDSMQFTLLRDRVRTILNTNVRLLDLQLQAGASGDEVADAVQFNVVAGAPYPVQQVYAGESVTSARALMQKPSQIFNSGTVNCKTIVHQGPTIRADAPSVAIPAKVFSLPVWYKTLFVGVAGSERVKLMNVDSTTPFPVGVYPVAPATGVTVPLDVIPMLSPLQWMNTVTGGCETTIPYYTPLKYSPAQKDYSVATQPFRYCQIVRPLPTGDSMAIFWSFGPDLRIVGFRQVPEIVLGLDTIVQTWDAASTV